MLTITRTEVVSSYFCTGATIFRTSITDYRFSVLRLHFVCSTDAFEKAGLKVWVDVIRLQPGVDFLTKIGDAIIDSKVKPEKRGCTNPSRAIYILQQKDKQ